MDPSSESSPRITRSAIWRRWTLPCAASTPRAIGKSNAAPALRTSAGARLTTIRWAGNSKPELRMALLTRSRLSRTLASGRPTIVKPGKPNDTSTSTWTGQASTPKRAAVRSHVMGLELVLADGTVVETGGKETDLPGYDLTGLLTGSEGTMALITKVTLRQIGRAEAVKTILAVYDSNEDAGRTVAEITARAITP